MAEPAVNPDGEGSKPLPLVDLIIRLGVIGFLMYWALLLIEPFVIITIWGGILAVALQPVHRKLAGWVGGRSGVSALVIALLGLTIVLGPVALIGSALVDNAADLGQRIEAGNVTIPTPPDDVRDWPVVGTSLGEIWYAASENLDQALEKYRGQIKNAASNLLSFTASAGLGLLQFAGSVIIAAIMLHTAPGIANGLGLLAARLSPERGAAILKLSQATTRNVARGVVGISLLQTFVVALGYWFVDFPFGGLLILVCLILSLVQIGPGIPLIASMIVAFSLFDTTTAVLFTVYMIPAMLLDNILKPIVLSAGLSTPMLVIFIGVIGGTMAHGVIGLFIGPVILAICYELIVAWVKLAGAERDTADNTDA